MNERKTSVPTDRGRNNIDPQDIIALCLPFIALHSLTAWTLFIASMSRNGRSASTSADAAEVAAAAGHITQWIYSLDVNVAQICGNYHV